MLKIYRIGLMATLAVATMNSYTGFAKELSDEEKLAVITKLTPHMLEQAHYRQTEFGDDISSLAFDRYFELLDPQKSFFTQADIDALEKYRFKLDDLTDKGNNHFVFYVYDLYKSRVNEFREFAEGYLSSSIDFTTDEEMLVDRSEASYPKDKEELKAYWQQRLKNEVLFNKLANRIRDYEFSHPEEQEHLSEDEQKKLDKSEAVEKLWRRSPEEQVLRRLRDMCNEIDQADEITILGTFLTAITRSYGPHSDYLAPVVDENFDITMKLSLYGIGATLTVDDGYVRVVDIVPGSPAAKEGTLKAGDRIIAVAQDGEEPVDVIDMALDKVVKMVRGEEGTKVTLTILAGANGRHSMPEYVTIVRAKVELKDSEASGKVYEVESGDETIKLGVIKLDSFYMDFDAYLSGDPNYKSCTKDMKKILDDFTASGVEGVVVDMRNNGGGSLPEAITLSGLFIEEGPIVQVRAQNRDINVQSDTDSDISFDGPLVVLTSRFTSSAAEIFSGAMKDYNRGLLMGDSRTYGKGTVLEVAKLDRVLSAVKMAFPAGSLKYECAMFYRVNGESNQAKGIETDIVFPSYTNNMEVGEEFSPNHLPWDVIPPADFSSYDADFAPVKSQLIAMSEERLAADENYQTLKQRVAMADEARERDTISLNEEARFDEYLETKDIPELNIDDVSATGNKDLLLNEALNVLTDWVDLKSK